MPERLGRLELQGIRLAYESARPEESAIDRALVMLMDLVKAQAPELLKPAPEPQPEQTVVILADVVPWLKGFMRACEIASASLAKWSDEWAEEIAAMAKRLPSEGE